MREPQQSRSVADFRRPTYLAAGSFAEGHPGGPTRGGGPEYSAAHMTRVPYS